MGALIPKSGFLENARFSAFIWLQSSKLTREEATRVIVTRGRSRMFAALERTSNSGRSKGRGGQRLGSGVLDDRSRVRGGRVV
jgi:hypothetical protein